MAVNDLTAKELNNYFRNITKGRQSYKAENTKITSYIEEECLQIINYLEDDLLASHKTEFLFNPAHRVIKGVKM